jgi:hypothetical protein
MLTDFSKLNEPYEVFEDPVRFVEQFKVSKDVRNIPEIRDVRKAPMKTGKE